MKMWSVNWEGLPDSCMAITLNILYASYFSDFIETSQEQCISVILREEHNVFLFGEIIL